MRMILLLFLLPFLFPFLIVASIVLVTGISDVTGLGDQFVVMFLLLALVIWRCIHVLKKKP
jgi:hypothetical protein